MHPKVQGVLSLLMLGNHPKSSNSHQSRGSHIQTSSNTLGNVQALAARLPGGYPWEGD